MAVSLIKVAIKGGDVYSTVSGIVDNAKIIANPNASVTDKLAAAADIALDVGTGVNVKDIRKVAEKAKDNIKTLAKAGGKASTDLGKAGEKASREITGRPKNTIKIGSASGKKYRTPDHMDEAQRDIIEVKNVKKQHLSSQILDNKAHVQRDGGAGHAGVMIDERTEITTPLLREHLNLGSPIKLRTEKLNE